MLPIIDAQKRIANVWIWGGTIVLIILISQSLTGKYGVDYLKVIAWFSQNILPTMAIIIATIVHLQRNTNKFQNKKVDKFYFRLCRNMSFFYFLIVLFCILLQPLIYTFSGLSGLEVLTISSNFLPLLQGILNAILGIFFLNHHTT